MIDKTIDLLIRAQIEKGKDLDSITKSIKELEAAIDKQSAAAKRGEASIDELKATLLALQQAQERLKSTGRLIDDFTKLSDRIARTEERVRSTAKAYDDYAAQLAKADKVTDAQQERQIKLGKAAEKAQTSLENQRKSLALLTESLQTAGIETNNLAAAKDRILVSAASLGSTMAKTSQSISTYSEDVRAARKAESELAAQRAQSAREQAQFAATEERYAKAAEQRRRDAEDYERIIGDRNAKIAADRMAAQEDEKRAQRARELAELRADIQRRSVEEEERIARAGEAAAAARFDREKRERETRERELAELRTEIQNRYKQRDADDGLKRTGEEAEQAAKGYNTLSRAATNLKPKITSLRDAVDSILDPSKAARSSLQGVSDEVGDLTKTIQSINGPVQNYRDLLTRLAAAQKELGRQSELVDGFQRQVVALRAARTEYTQARAKVLEYAAAVKQGGEAGAAQTRALAEAQTRARAAAQALQQQILVTRDSRQALRDAGIATNDLAGAQRTLTANAQASVAATKSLTQAYEQHGASVEKATKSKKLFRDEGRTTLSYVQRIRGEILSLAAAYVGLFSAINVAKGSIEAMNQQQGIESRLSVVVGSNDTQEIGKAYDYVAKRADYYGFSIKELAQAYSAYGIAAKSADLTAEQTNYTFEQLTAGMRVLKLNTDQSSRAWTQIQQILSKTKPEMEDIKTIAESGFVGVQGMMARGLMSIGVAGVKAGSEVNDMFQLMKAGMVDSRQAIFALAVQAEKELGIRVPEAIKSLQAEQGRFETAVFNFQKEIAKSGWADAYTDALKAIAEFLKSEDGVRVAQSASDAFSGLAKILVLVIENIDLVKTALLALAAVWGVGKLKGGIEWFNDLRKGAGLATTAMKAFGSVFFWIRAIIIAWQIGQYLYDKFEVVRKAVDWIVKFAQKSWIAIKVGFEEAMKAVPAAATNAFKFILNRLTMFARGFLGVMGVIAKAAGLDSVEQAISGVVANLTFEYEKLGTSTARVADRIRQEWRDLDNSMSDISVEMSINDLRAGDDKNGTTPKPGVPTNRLLGGDDEKGLAKRKAMIEEITRALEQIETKIDRSQTDTLEAQLRAIDTQYQALSRKIEKLGGETGRQFALRLAAGTAQLRSQTVAKFEADLEKDRQALLRKIEQADAAAGRKAKTDLDARLQAIDDSYAAHYRELADLRAKFVANDRDPAELDEGRTRLDLAIAEQKRLEIQKFGQEQLRFQEERINYLLQNREKLIAAINAQRQAGIIDDVQAAQAINAINAQALPAITAAATQAKEWALANDQIFAQPEDLQVFLSTMDAIVARVAAAKTEFTVLQNAIINGSLNIINNGLNTIADGFQAIVTGQKSVGEGFRDMITGFAQFAAQFLRDIALMIIKLMIFKALQNSGNQMLAAIGTAGQASMGVRHSGGVIGSPGGRTRRVSSAWFADAPRYHSGGMPGLRQDEYATILQRGEEVLAADSPRNILNGGAGVGGAGKSEGRGVRFVLVDDRSRIPEAMASAEGDEVIVQSIRKNVSTIRQMLRG